MVMFDRRLVAQHRGKKENNSLGSLQAIFRAGATRLWFLFKQKCGFYEQGRDLTDDDLFWGCINGVEQVRAVT